MSPRILPGMSRIAGTGCAALALALVSSSSASSGVPARLDPRCAMCRDAGSSFVMVGGIARQRPPTWVPNRIPRRGLGVKLTALKWSGWNSARPTATGRMEVCTSVPRSCDTAAVRIAVFRREPATRIYQCLKFLTGPPELRWGASYVGSDPDARFDICTRA